MNKLLKIIETKRLAKETIQDALVDCEGWTGSIVLGIMPEGDGKIFCSDLTPSELTYLKEILNCHIRDMFDK